MNLFSQIHEICFYSKGGYNFETIYNMPIWLRNFIHNKMCEHYDKEKKSYDGSTNNPQGSTIKIPNFIKPSNVTKK